MTITKHVVITGRVQGVFYRASARSAGIGCGVSGWVRNCRDGSVEAVVQGSADQVDRFVQWCWEGPPLARVAAVDMSAAPLDETLEGFEVRY